MSNEFLRRLDVALKIFYQATAYMLTIVCRSVFMKAHELSCTVAVSLKALQHVFSLFLREGFFKAFLVELHAFIPAIELTLKLVEWHSFMAFNFKVPNFMKEDSKLYCTARVLL